MSANQGSEAVAAPAANNPAPAPVAASEGPRIITVLGQESQKAEPAPAAAAPETPSSQAPAAGSEEKKDPVEGDGEGNPQDRDEKTGRFKPGVQKRIDELTRQRHDAEREAAYWRGIAEGAGAKPTDQSKSAPAEVKPPVRTDFATDDEYIDAMADFKVEQKLQQREAQQKQQAAVTEKATTWQQKVEAAKAAIPDYDEVLEASADMVVKPHVSELLMEHDDGAKIVHFLASNPAALEKLNGMSPAKAAFELASIAAKFAAPAAPSGAAPAPGVAGQNAPSASSKPAAERAVSKAPPPAASNVGAGRATESKLEDLSMDDYVARRKAQGAGWANR